jgi:DNA-binding MarR family transcriptional regulator
MQQVVRPRAPGDVNPPGTGVAHLLARADQRVSSAITSALIAEGSTLERWRVLSLLTDGLGHPMSEIASHVFVPPPTLTKVVDRLVADNLVHRHVDPSDRRRVLVLLTARGRSSQRRLDRVVEKRMADALSDLGTADVVHLARLLALVKD